MRSAKATCKQLKAAREEAGRSLSSVRKQTEKKKYIAALVSDLHIDRKTPVARAEKDWFEVQAKYFKQLRSITETHGVPLVIAGDLFNKAHPDPETINFAMEQLPEAVYAVPGQHDLQYHNYKDIKKTGYWTLCANDRIRNLSPDAGPYILQEAYTENDWYLVGVPWGYDIPKLDKKEIEVHERYLAVIHAYIWRDDENHYPGAPKDATVSKWRHRLKNYSAAVFGDNHIGFLDRDPHCPILNCGGFINRRTDERLNSPTIGLLSDQGEIDLKFFPNTIDDKWSTRTDIENREEVLQAKEFLEELAHLSNDSLDFVSAIEQIMEQQRVKPEVKRIIHKALEKSNK